MSLLKLSHAEHRALRETVHRGADAFDVIRARVLLEVAAGRAVDRAARDAGVSPGLVYRWLFEYQSRRRGDQAVADPYERSRSNTVSALRELAKGATSPTNRYTSPVTKPQPEPPGERRKPRHDDRGRSWQG